MIRNYIKTIIRIFWRFRLNSFINLLGLALGITAGFMILTHIRDEISYDRFFPKADRIYRVISEAHYGDQVRNWAPTAPVLAEEITRYYPEIEKATHFRYMHDLLLEYRPDGEEPRLFREKWGFYTDSAALEIFDIELLQGDPETALRDIFSIVITPGIAEKYFGDEDPMGKTLFMESTVPLTVTGVIKPLPPNTHFKFDFLVSFNTFTKQLINAGYEELYYARTWAAVYTYVLLHENNTGEQVESKFPAFLMEYFQFDGPVEELLAERNFSLQPITDIHLRSNLEQEMRRNGNIVYVLVFTLAALFILFIAGVNFVNITTSQSFKRMKEVGIRRVMGAHRSQVGRQFLGEAIVVTVIAAFIGLLLIDLLMPLYNQLSGKSIILSQVFNSRNVLMMIGVVLLVGILSGIYPAFFVSSFKPVESIKGIKDPKSSSNRLRKALLITQFILAGFLTFSTIIIYSQMNYFFKEDLGYEEKNLIAINVSGNLQRFASSNPEALKSELSSHPSILSISFISTLPGQRYSVEALVPDSFPEDTDLPSMRFMRADEDYITTMGLELVEGKDCKEMIHLPHVYIINEKAVESLNLASPVGSRGSSTFGGEGEIIGVVKDFHFASFHSLIEPMVIEYFNSSGEVRMGVGYILIRIKSGQFREALSHLRETINRIVPESLFSYEVLEENLKNLYGDEKHVLDLFKAFALLSIFISCLGLFGMSAYSSELRVKEIGIRKTFGASLSQIVLSLSEEYIKFIVAAVVIAIPVAWYVMHRWLQNFPFHIRITWWVAVLSILLITLVAILTVSYQAIKAGLGKPVDALRYE